MENPSMHRALEHTLAFSFHYFNTKLPDPAKALIQCAQGIFFFLLVEVFFSISAIFGLLNSCNKWSNDYWDLRKFLEIQMRLQMYALKFVYHSLISLTTVSC